MQDIEDLVNKEVLRDHRVEVIEDVPIDVAVNEYKAMALFGEKYGDRVRVIRSATSPPNCAAARTPAATGEIGLIKILEEGSVSSGVRRVEAVAGESSLRHFRDDHELEMSRAGWCVPATRFIPPALQARAAAREEEIKSCAGNWSRRG